MAHPVLKRLHRLLDPDYFTKAREFRLSDVDPGDTGGLKSEFKAEAKALPERGRIGIFIRSYYEDVLIVRVHEELLARLDAPEKHRKFSAADVAARRKELALAQRALRRE